ncbi:MULTISPECIES: bifunctional 3-(3-hydroxy-phenyl)propionate/3-hydroxycinnamic acid hydroxylase [unclassified Caballeronia]|uniref:bifunctional 3-(3-hydroxy-phenyl)propionate/3-hydroxycinnamic acid hydroxylase MhpA n=1 Tax=unclassified Caballeronia TaxID=2646786 RepID=UPI0028638412|nr:MULTISPECIES: bifunctional 3-(3-hydroxy-phenyl)propionate/3-hydroxycinnamic acid hydroxylase [unclassified Caballeronia]MDR5822988.1 bifunctional 3-(3-hydroxy-phenyl)propionate/3-hydroxycinnamic acid hydroxylase [Caballeronia sp. LZ043]MDR5881047.1 bifunctional 3-(3-hydroxy-phenyl)propionate/3-hydroxycinnamic acid hydroxylase [Caballeronia sp. LZ032]
MADQIIPTHTCEYDVAIIGLGPTGATLGNLLALQGLRVLVLERDKDIFGLPRALHFDGECMRVFQTLGIADALLPNLFVGPGMKFVNAQGRLLIDWQRPTCIGPHGWCASYKFHQPELENALRDRLARQANADVRLRHEVFALDETAEGIQLRFEDTSCGRFGRATARYVVGCDGARSIARRFMGTELTDLKSHERWVVVDVMLDAPRPDLGDYSIQYCDPARPCTYTRGPGNRRRWEIMVMPDDDPAQLSSSDWLWDKLARWVTPADARLERSALYTFHSVVARGWRRGALLLAGDAAHQTPPFMGQGMAAGIRDASNLAWKLGAVLRGEASESLLDTYESERSPHVREFIETAVQLGAVIQMTHPDLANARDRDMADAIRRFVTPQPQLGPGAWQEDASGTAGHVAPQPRLDDGRLLDDTVGYRFALVALPGVLAACPDLHEPAAQADLVLVESNAAPVRDWLAATGAVAVLLRPDRYVFGVAPDLQAVDGLLARALPRYRMEHA